MIMRKGLFIFNPCHLSCLGVIVMCLKSSTSTMRTFHTMWTSWIFGAALALSVPHLNGVSEVEIYLYYLEHYLIVPIGPVILYRRYGFLQPTVKNQLAAFSSMVCYQLSILFILSITTKVNLNFVLCHSPGDPFYPYLGHWYFPFSVYYLNFASWLFRYFLFIFLSPLKLFWKNPESEPIKPSSNSLSIDMWLIFIICMYSKFKWSHHNEETASSHSTCSSNYLRQRKSSSVDCCRSQVEEGFVQRYLHSLFRCEYLCARKRQEYDFTGEPINPWNLYQIQQWKTQIMEWHQHPGNVGQIFRSGRAGEKGKMS